MAAGQRVVVDDTHYRVVEKPTHVSIYRTYGKNGYFREVMVWNSKKRPTPRIGSTLARVLAAVL